MVLRPEWDRGCWPHSVSDASGDRGLVGNILRECLNFLLGSQLGIELEKDTLF